MKRVLSLIVVAFMVAAVSASARGVVSARHAGVGARAESKVRESRARISMKKARATALAQVPGGRIKSSELEREGGKLIYSFDIRAGQGIKEVHVDAITGAVLEMKDESPSDEAKEHREHKTPRP